MQLARNGHRHPDAQVASAAEEWAHYVIGRPPSRILLNAIYEVVAVGGLYALTHWLFGTNFQGYIVPLFRSIYHATDKR
jgi:hypothetical protein